MLTKLTIAFVAFNPITKYPLSINPINAQLQIIAGGYRVFVCLCSAVLVLGISIFFPGFHNVMVIWVAYI
jgi:hypothetical protein